MTVRCQDLVLNALCEIEDLPISLAEIHAHVSMADPVFGDYEGIIQVEAIVRRLHRENVIWCLGKDGQSDESQYVMALRYPTEEEGISKEEITEAFDA